MAQQIAASKNGPNPVENPPQKPAPKPVQNPSQKDSASKQLWVLDQALLKARGQAKRDLLLQREQLLSSATGVDLSSPAPSPAPLPAKPPRKVSAAERDLELLVIAQTTLKDSPDALSEDMVKALLTAGYRLPAVVAARFPKLVKQTDNPVPE